VELVVISIALSAGIIDQKIFTAIVAMVAVTVIVTPILLKQAIAFLEKQEL
jgi:Kef-type K+ transport system membrane component KefB